MEKIRQCDVRVGNEVLVHGILKKVTLQMLYEGGISEYMTGVPLNENWFINFGFEKQFFIDKRNYTPVEKTVYKLGNKIIVDNLDGDYMYVMISDGLFLNGYTRNFKYVHELQNLHFELKREELTLKQ